MPPYPGLSILILAFSSERASRIRSDLPAAKLSNSVLVVGGMEDVRAVLLRRERRSSSSQLVCVEGEVVEALGGFQLETLQLLEPGIIFGLRRPPWLNAAVAPDIVWWPEPLSPRALLHSIGGFRTGIALSIFRLSPDQPLTEEALLSEVPSA